MNICLKFYVKMSAYVLFLGSNGNTGFIYMYISIYVYICKYVCIYAYMCVWMARMWEYVTFWNSICRILCSLFNRCADVSCLLTSLGTYICLILLCPLLRVALPVYELRNTMLLNIYTCFANPGSARWLLFQWEAVCGPEGCQKCWRLYGNSTRWDQVVTLCKWHYATCCQNLCCLQVSKAAAVGWFCTL